MSDLISREETYKILCEEYPLLQKEYLKRVIDKVPSAEPVTCAYWDRESNICALHRPSAQSERMKGEEMTIAEANKMLTRIKDRINFEVTDSQPKMDALNMAIKALSAQKRGERIIETFNYELAKIAKDYYDDPEESHYYADRLMVDTLKDLGFDLRPFEDMCKWYA